MLRIDASGFWFYVAMFWFQMARNYTPMRFRVAHWSDSCAHFQKVILKISIMSFSGRIAGLIKVLGATGLSKIHYVICSSKAQTVDIIKALKGDPERWARETFPRTTSSQHPTSTNDESPYWPQDPFAADYCPKKQCHTLSGSRCEFTAGCEQVRNYQISGWKNQAYVSIAARFWKRKSPVFLPNVECEEPRNWRRKSSNSFHS